MLASLTTANPSISLFAILSLGFFLGMRHATDTDHVVAVSTIVSRERRIGSAALIGGMWGVGHTITILAVGAGIILFTLVIPPRLGLSMEFSVGLMLIFLGLLNLRAFRSQTNPADAKALPPGTTSSPAAAGHTHERADAAVEFMDTHVGRSRIYQWLRPLLVGLVHGLAGSAAVALLVLTTLHDPHWAVAYLFIFGVGTIAGMMVITVAMASALRFAGQKSQWLNRKLAFGTGLLSLAFGMFIVYRMGYVDGLFTAHPAWTPE